jgi:hypothetical protein
MPAKTEATVFNCILMPLAIMGNLIGNEKSGLSKALLKSARGDVVQSSRKSGVPASSKS